MSLESTVANLITACGQLMALPQQIADAALARIAAIGQAFQDTITTGNRTFWVDQVNGLDTNAGTSALPLKTLNKAVALTPRGGNCWANLKNDYLVDANITLDGHRLVINGETSKRALNFTKATIVTSGGTTTRSLKSFRMVGHAESLVFLNLAIVMPTPTGPEAALVEDREAAIVASVGDINSAQNSVVFGDCTITANTDRYGPLISVIGAMAIFYSTSVDGTRGHMRGRVFMGVAADAGVNPNTLSTFHSNLALV